ncbi:uncharacterized protein N7459_000105, partial [Penicillium hispanicum]|uniref:uncharacterized protein n=1 Tax=Penicillium hispanicum TaxID=1080232 RepID=UPI00253F8C8A
MASLDEADPNEMELKDVFEDLELHRVIYDDLMEARPDDKAAIAETLDVIKRLESRVKHLVGEASPPSPIQDPASTNSSPPHPEPTQLTPHTSTIPMDPISVPYWPSSAPSPFVAQPSQHDEPSMPLPSTQSVPEGSRKRARHDSTSPSAQPQSSKRAAVSQSMSRMAEIEENLQKQLDENRRLFAEMTDPESIRLNASLEGITEAQAREDMAKEQEESERAIRTSYQMSKDEEFARMLQAQDEPSEEERDLNPPSRSNLPERTYLDPLNHLPSIPPSFLSSLRPSHTPSSAPSFAPSYDPFSADHFYPNRFPDPPAFPSSGDDDLQEISADRFHSRSTYPFRAPPVPSNLPNHSWQRDLSMRPGMPPGSFPGAYSDPLSNLSPRPLPWMRDTKFDAKALDLVREQQDLDNDEIDFERYEEKDFPEDIRNLLTGIKDINNVTKMDDNETPRALKATLMKHQKVGLAWLKAKEESKHKGGILADDMGLGKTIQTIALMAAHPPTDPGRHPCLIIAPKALMDQWRLEIQRHIKPGHHQLKVFIFHDRQRHVPWRELQSYDVVITTFGTLTANHKALLQAEKLQDEGKDASIVKRFQDKAVLFTPASRWHRVIVDEAQNIKNPAAKSTKACCQLNSTYRWCLTGTPMMNRLEDFQSLLKFLRIRPYNNKDKFRRDFIRPVKSGISDEHTMQQLRVLVKSVCLRRTKTSKIDGQPILQLPPKVTEKVHVVFGEVENETYQALSSKTQNQVSKYLRAGTLGANYSHILVLLLRLRQACCHPLLLQGFNVELPANVQGVDMVANAKLLTPEVVNRLKNNTDEDSTMCPICLDVFENTVIYIPCGHSVCTECFANVSNPSVLARNDDDSGTFKCSTCRGPVDPLKITDSNAFKKAHDPDSHPEQDTAKEKALSDDTDSDEYDSDTDTDGISRKPKKKSLAELRVIAQKNKREKKKYLRRLEKTWIPSAKIEKTIEILQANEDRGRGEKTIVFSQFTSLLDLLEVPINRRGWKNVRFDGTMNVNDRNASVREFTDDPSCRVMLVSLKAGNAGLNLVAASHVVLFDPFWNPYVEDQAIDRAHRIGQMKEVFVHRLLIENTVEDRIVELQDKKRELISGALDEGGTMNVSRLDSRELAYLF